jgi:histidyl-tRNA synthetase
MDLRAVKGMNDILPDEAARWQKLESAFRTHVSRYGYDEVRTPIIEHTALFSRQMGETTDVVEKEMYSFERHENALTVRPEGTAGAARAYVEHHVHAREPVSRWYYLGPMFRGERPAKGRYRQFYQAGCELYGDPGPMADAEMIEMVYSYLTNVLGIPVHQARAKNTPPPCALSSNLGKTNSAKIRNGASRKTRCASWIPKTRATASNSKACPRS